MADAAGIPTERLRELENRWRKLHEFAELLASVPMHARNFRLLAATIHDCKAAKAAYKAEVAAVGGGAGGREVGGAGR